MEFRRKRKLYVRLKDAPNAVINVGKIIKKSHAVVKIVKEFKKYRLEFGTYEVGYAETYFEMWFSVPNIKSTSAATNALLELQQVLWKHGLTLFFTGQTELVVKKLTPASFKREAIGVYSLDGHVITKMKEPEFDLINERALAYAEHILEKAL